MSVAETRTVTSNATATVPFGLRVAFNLCLVAAGLLLALLAGEALIRIVAPRQLYRFPVGLFRNDALLGYSLSPNFRGTIHAEEYTTEVRTNSRGLRADVDYGPEPSGTVRIMALGDSFTMAYSVDVSQTYPAVLERALRDRTGRDVQVINAGCGGYSPRQEFLYLKSQGLQLQPDIVVQGLYIGNDLEGNIPLKPQVGVTDGYLMSKNSSGGTLPRPIRLFLSRRSQLYNYVWPIQHALREGRKGWKPARALAKFRTDAPGIAPTEWDATMSVLQSTADLARSRGVNFIVALFPEGMQVDERWWQRTVNRIGETGAIYSPYELNHRVSKALAARHITTVDLLPAFLRARRDGRPFYFHLDSHWNAAGNLVAGERIADYLIGTKALRPAKQS